MKRLIAIVGVMAGLGLPGCGSSDPPAPEKTYTDSYQYVVKQLVFPDSVGHAMAVARDIDGDGTVENNLGQFLAVINTMAIPHGCEDAVNNKFKLGTPLLLMEVKANLDGTKSDKEAVLQMETGKDTNGDPSDNFSGTAELAPAAGAKAVINGEVDKLALRAGREKAFIPMAPGGEVRFIGLQLAMVEATITPDRLEDGIISGGVPWQEFKMLLLPGFAEVLSCVANNPIGGGG
jgi:hypothetical protein